MKNKANSLHYCMTCRVTTRHAASCGHAGQTTCLRCGVEKPVPAIVTRPGRVEADAEAVMA